MGTRAALIARILLALVTVGYLLQIFTPLRLNTDVITLLSAGNSASLGHGFLEDGHPTVFPPAYPSILCLLLTCGLGKSSVIVALNLGFLAVGMMTLFWLVRFAFDLPPTTAFLCVLFTLLSFVVVKHVTLALTDTLFLSLVLCCLAVMVRTDWTATRLDFWRWASLSAFMVVACILTRRNGIALIPPLAWILLRRPENRRSFNLGLSLLLLATPCFAATFTSTIHDLGSPPWTVLGVALYRFTEWGELTANVSAAKLPSFLAEIVIPVVGLGGLTLVLAGLYRRRHCIGPIEIFIPCYAAILFVWPFYDPRFWLAALPLLYAYAFYALHDRISGIWRPVAAGYVTLYTMAGIMALGYSTYITFSGPKFPERYANATYQNSYCAVSGDCPANPREPKAEDKFIQLLRRYR